MANFNISIAFPFIESKIEGKILPEHQTSLGDHLW